MAKSRSKAKSSSNRKSAVKKEKNRKQRTRTAKTKIARSKRSGSGIARSRVASAPQLTVSNAKRVAVVTCFNAALSTDHHHWREEDVMGSDLGYTPITMPLFLSAVKTCLAPKGFTLTISPGLVNRCLAATVFAARLDVLGSTTP